ncbi:hypothetical protein M5X00_13035 [Paenibacillus alvei]|uniref:hypothetical protein n=1 Tax=Paenibacillus alvei TaxID=44250 RepID=UPI000289AF56|nr:hypothetical protein [Paenibacillus alvei]EJW13825.1 hypothetical protein PAV_109p00550 [Paenibacillus alvei DSM 29]MCY9540550.1 hypothetical protein [Paenibacillus alvei]MCY9708245.1 hypothetical protein [Paenibacillus alvei]MCY9732958.1 hypothetical protein [Paenibacillus alvei]MCY9755165.1 hypothetical protein [Paenibacillus alvei]
METLYVIALWHEGDQYAFAVVGETQEEAKAAAIDRMINEHELEENVSIEYDPEMSFEITEAGDIAGNCYDIRLSKQNL